MSLLSGGGLIERIMLGQQPPGAMFLPLLAAQKIYSTGVYFKNRMYDSGMTAPFHAPGQVISVGGLTLGGAGKTPLAMYIAGLLRLKRKVGILSRGYGQLAKQPVLVVSDGKTLCAPPPYSADEAYMMARKLPGVPVVTAPDRALGAKAMVERLGVEVIVLDDGFQHRRLFRDVDIVLVDHHALDPLRRQLAPLGYLREPVDSLTRADVAVVMIRAAGDMERLEDNRATIRRLAGKDIPIASATGALAGFATLDGKEAEMIDGPALAFCGIAQPGGFAQTLMDARVPLASRMAFPDHHQYTSADIRLILDEVRRTGAAWIITTEKDAARLAGMGETGEMERRLRIARWEMKLDGFKPEWIGLE